MLLIEVISSRSYPASHSRAAPALELRLLMTFGKSSEADGYLTFCVFLVSFLNGAVSHGFIAVSKGSVLCQY